MWQLIGAVNVQAFLIGLVLFLLAYNYLSKESWRRLPPGPINLPLLGSLPFLQADLREPLLKMADRYGDVFTVYLGLKRCVVLNGYVAIKEAFVKHGYTFTGRPHIPFFDLNHNLGIGTVDGELWKEQRRFAHTILKDFGFGRSILEDRILEEVKKLLNLLDDFDKQPINPHMYLQMAFSNVIGNVAFGRRLEYDDPKFITYMKLMNNSFELISKSAILNAFPFLKYLPGDVFGIKLLKAGTRYMRQEHRILINEHKADFKNQIKPTNFIDVYLQAIDREKNNPKTTFTEEQLLSLIADLHGAGTETSSTTTTWAIMYMIHYPEVQRKIQAEIDDVIGYDRLPSLHDRNNLPYLNACICEIQRMADIVPLSVPRATMEDVEFRGYFIPKGTMILPSLYSVHRDPKTWPNPHQFDPDRFLDEDGQLMKREELIPFSLGKRLCLGEGLAKMELYLFLAAILQRYRITLPEGDPLPDTKGILSITNLPKPFKVILERRA